MVIHRGYVKTTFNSGRTLEFNPFFTWHLERGMGWFGIRQRYEIGFYWGYKIGNWSRIKTRFIEIGKLTLFVHYGKREPWNPRTGETVKA